MPEVCASCVSRSPPLAWLDSRLKLKGLQVQLRQFGLQTAEESALPAEELSADMHLA